MNDFDFEPGYPMRSDDDADGYPMSSDGDADGVDLEQLVTDGYVSFETDAAGEQCVVLTELGRIALSIGDQHSGSGPSSSE